MKASLLSPEICVVISLAAVVVDADSSEGTALAERKAVLCRICELRWVDL